MKDSDAGSHGSLAHVSLHAEQHLDQFSRFCAIHSCAQHTDRHIPICSNRWCGLIKMGKCLPEVRLKVRPLIGSLGGGDHQLMSEPTSGTWRSTPWQSAIRSLSQLPASVWHGIIWYVM